LIELLRTNDLVLISRIEAILAETGIDIFIADRHMSAVEGGSLSFLPRRVLVASEAWPRARRILMDAGLASELRDG
jgi:Putative prokaryotic signal transducing protein